VTSATAGEVKDVDALSTAAVGVGVDDCAMVATTSEELRGAHFEDLGVCDRYRTYKMDMVNLTF